jgi:hypothetical protein
VGGRAAFHRMPSLLGIDTVYERGAHVRRGIKLPSPRGRQAPSLHAPDGRQADRYRQRGPPDRHGQSERLDAHGQRQHQESAPAEKPERVRQRIPLRARAESPQLNESPADGANNRKRSEDENGAHDWLIAPLL